MNERIEAERVRFEEFIGRWYPNRKAECERFLYRDQCGYVQHAAVVMWQTWIAALGLEE
jgi:hypothetical protein